VRGELAAKCRTSPGCIGSQYGLIQSTALKDNPRTVSPRTQVSGTGKSPDITGTGKSPDITHILNFQS
jgi:hypothetical protein